MGNFAENLNLGNRFRPPLFTVSFWAILWVHFWATLIVYGFPERC